MKKFIWPIVFSLGVHLIVFSYLPILMTAEFELPALYLKKNENFKVETITPEQMKKYRTVGIKNGSKDFSLPMQKGSGAKKFEKRVSEPSNGKSQTGAISFKSLQAGSAGSKMKPNAKSVEEVQKENEKDAKITYAVKQQNKIVAEKQRRLQENILEQFAANPENQQVLKRTGFNIDFRTPEGVDEDELNSAEKIYWSFRKRTYIAYVSSFIKTYNRMLLERPSVKGPLKDGRHTMTGKIIFDREGNIIKIKILRSSSSDDMHLLFEETLKEIRKLPNPPNDILEEGENFTIYYQLRINT